MPLQFARDTPSAIATTSSEAQCGFVTSATTLCTTDIIAIVVVAFFVWYIVWGIPMTIRVVQRVKAKISARRQRRRLKTRVYLNGDIEMGMKDQGNEDPIVYADPFLASTKRLRTFLYLTDKVTIPERTYIPKPETMELSWEERERLDSFKFPPDLSFTSSPTLQPSLSSCSVLGLYSPPSGVEDADHDEPNSPAWASFPPPPGLATSEELGPLDLNVFARLDPLPSSPPPAYLHSASRGRRGSVCQPCTW
ncbi:hypothetical protein C8Q70DRAFT_1055813 [Cubamyces menziesii]|uniref:Uncharacterized protein n=1 Tax=Trametes cubensis TaxID=1111947 RepID=A0AAD7TGQ6_9APHY|nr:hypothetical protein C8Q70DRAFT_1055813 [Cubamyces menziesii]KAJ8453913.1 hypothetical protein ONZ51_g13332 [Trametes cubensis]